jgi:hypothetical protein
MPSRAEWCRLKAREREALAQTVTKREAKLELRQLARSGTRSFVPTSPPSSMINLSKARLSPVVPSNCCRVQDHLQVFRLRAWCKFGVTYNRSEMSKSAIYLECLPLFTRGIIRIPDHPRLCFTNCGCSNAVRTVAGRTASITAATVTTITRTPLVACCVRSPARPLTWKLLLEPGVIPLISKPGAVLK